MIWKKCIVFILVVIMQGSVPTQETNHRDLLRQDYVQITREISQPEKIQFQESKNTEQKLLEISSIKESAADKYIKQNTEISQNSSPKQIEKRRVGALVQRRVLQGIEREEKGIKPETLTSRFSYRVYRKTLTQYYKFSWKNLAYGITFDELEKLLVIICCIRFCFYTIVYKDPKIALIICAISFISAIFYETVIIDCLRICNQSLYLNSSIFRFGFEEYLNGRAWKIAKKAGEVSNWKDKNNDFTVNLWWLRNFLDKFPTVLSEPLKSFEFYVTQTLIPEAYKTLRLYEHVLKSMLVYTMILRAGKEFVPYHMQWHLTLYVLYSQTGQAMWERYSNSLEFLLLVLIPQHRVDEIEFMKILHSMFIGGLIYATLLAMLHAIFSQYFYCPLLVPNIEAHIGKRPKDSIYTGGYTSWQDEQELFAPSRADWKIWFGFLGKSSNDWKHQKKRKNNSKRPWKNW